MNIIESWFPLTLESKCARKSIKSQCMKTLVCAHDNIFVAYDDDWLQICLL